MFCKSCGKELSENQRFCSNCGTPIAGNNAEEPHGGYKLTKPIAGRRVLTKPIAGKRLLTKPAPNFQSVDTNTVWKICAVVVLVLGFIGFFVLIKNGVDLTELRSVAGDTVAEAYYQSMGAIFIGAACFELAVTIYIAVESFLRALE